MFPNAANSINQERDGNSNPLNNRGNSSVQDSSLNPDRSSRSSSSGPSSVAAPTISLPKGGGAIKGIGEKFAANPATGTGSLTVPIATSPGRVGFGPQQTRGFPNTRIQQGVIPSGSGDGDCDQQHTHIENRIRKNGNR